MHLTHPQENTIDALIEERAVKDGRHLSRIEQDNTALDNTHITFDEDAQCWRLASQREDCADADETIFTVTGAIEALDLLLILKEYPAMKDKLRFMTQKLTLTGLGSVRFKGSVEALKEIERTGEREFREGQLQGWMPTQVQGYDAIELANRYFRPRGKDYHGEEHALSDEVDPKGILKRNAGSHLIHTKDNEVLYFRGIIEKGKKKYIKAKPQIFRIGDIVEAQCSIVFIKAKGGDIRMKLVLRAIALVNYEHSMNADRARKGGVEWEGNYASAPKVKRKIGFEYEDEEDVAEGKRQHIEVNEGDKGREKGEGMVVEE
ncbi:uncharacterized protein ARMOST_09164 [Armillaria ostoyae]|uniref:Uncharacterized protein n=1 Tax=Armillaria ostoyae TaxID=47428 RepID=A0A284RAT2_ARMOS|nr:uncharacterized protein ARMOST_09164 [Armillaria ostoyae]